MKLLKMAGLAAIAALGLMAFAGAGSASATTLTCTNPPGTKVTCPAGTNVDLSAESSLLIKAGFANITCTESTIKGKTSNTGSATETVKGNIETLTFSPCNATVTVLRKGSLEVHTDEEGITSGNGTLTGSGTEFTVAVSGVTCTYGTSNTDLGTLTGSSPKSNATATLDLTADLLKFAGGFLCASPARWEGTYTVTEPDWLDVD